VSRVSSFYRTEPVGYAEQPFFYNAVARISWTGSARSLLSLAKRIERRLGRVPTFRNGPRLIDIDVLDLEGAVSRGPDPALPHPRLTRRRFVLAPLAEIAPSWRHPVTGLPAREMLAKLPRRPGVRKIRSRR
jgi:2-amino-4-hydroxy-6-hydroxymethyldihydropteridine diphosphokinase